MKKLLGISAVESEKGFPFGKQTLFFQEMQEISRDMPIELVFFSPLSWSEATEEIKGYVYKNKTWERTFFNLPGIIFDRTFITNRLEKQKINLFRSYLNTHKVHVLNPLNLALLLDNKVNFYKFLLEHNLPTVPIFTISDINVDFFEKQHEKVFYLKPISSFGGYGIHIIDMRNETIVLKNTINTRFMNFNSTVSLLAYITQAFPVTEYFLQINTNTTLFNERPFDIRVIVQNQGYNLYKVTGSAVRIGLKGSFVSNLNNGGSVLPVEALTNYYSKYFNKNIEKELVSIANLCTRCCHALHQKYGNFLEIGFDILLTHEAGPVILEANAKPARWIFKALANNCKIDAEKRLFFNSLRDKSVKAPLLYTVTNFKD